MHSGAIICVTVTPLVLSVDHQFVRVHYVLVHGAERGTTLQLVVRPRKDLEFLSF